MAAGGGAQDGQPDDELPPGQCRAEVVDRSVDFARVRRRERLRSTFWYIPTSFIVASVALAIGLHRVDVALSISPDDAPWWMSSSSSATTVLSTIASAMLTFVGVVFSVTLVALQLASSQLSPRVLRSFVRSPVPKLAFGTFMATFFFSLFMLAQASGNMAGIPVVGATTAILMVAASVVMFVIYIDATVRQMQVSEVISRVASETRRAIERNYESPTSYVTAAEPDLGGGSVTIAIGRRRATVKALNRRGVLLGIDVARIVDWAEEHDAVVEQLARIGDYTPGGTALFDVYGVSEDEARQLAEMVDLGRERTLYQDPLYGVRQLVDTAAQALSAAINAPTTAVQVLDRLVDIMVRIGRLPSPSPYVVDAAGTVRLVHPVLDWEQVVQLAFVEIRQFGATATQVTRRLMAAFDAIEQALPAGRAAPIEAQRAALVRAVTRVVVDDEDRAFALQPDETGLA